MRSTDRMRGTSPGSPHTKTGWPLLWDQPTTVCGDEDAQRLLETCLLRRAMMLDALKSRKQVTGDRSAKRMSRRYMSSFSAKAACLAMAHQRKCGPLREATPGQLSALVALAGVLTPWKAPPDRSQAFPRDRKNGGIRYVHAQTLRQYALALLAKDALGLLAKIHPTQFIVSGGRPKMEGWLEEKLPSADLIITTDVPECFDTVRRDRIVDGLPLPRRVTKEVLFEPKRTARYLIRSPKGLIPKDHSLIAEVSSPERGIPQGSALSSLAVETLMRPVLEAVAETAPGVHVATYGDNIIIVLENAASKESVISALREGVRNVFGFPVLDELTRRIRYWFRGGGVIFCGRHYRWYKGKFRKSLPADRKEAFSAELFVDIDDAKHSDDPPAAFEKIERRVHGWLGQNKDLPGALKEAAEVLAQLINAGHHLKKT